MAPATVATLPQAKRLLELLDESGATNEQVQGLLGAGDLLQLMLTTDLTKVDRRVFAQLLAGKLQLVDRFAHLLLPVDELLAQLLSDNVQYWDRRLTEEQFAAVDTSSYAGHVQRLDDLVFPFAWMGSLEETVEMNWRSMVGKQPKNWRWPELKLDAEHLRLWPSNVRSYEPGIHMVRLNLLAHWEPQTGRTLDEVRDQAEANGETLAHVEVMAALALLPELLREQDGENLPYMDMPGTDVTVPGDSRRCALDVCWSPFRDEVYLYAGWAGYRGQGWSAPVLRES